MGPSRHGTIRGHKARRRPNRCAAHREPFSCVEFPGARKTPRHGATSNGSACRSGRMHLGAGTRQAEPRPARQSVLVAVVRIVTWGVDSAPHRGVFRAPPFISSYAKGRPRNTPHKTAGRSASPKGEARRGVMREPWGATRVTGERLATGVLAIGGPVATAPYGDIRLGADPIAALPIASRSPV